MKNKKTIQKILIALLVAIVLLVAYAMLAPKPDGSGSGSSALSSLTGSSPFGQVQETDATLANAEILKILGSIQNIELRDDIFTNPVFRTLKDTQFSIPKPTKIGRPNPFLPIGFDTLSPTTSTVEPTVENNTNSESSFFDFGELQDGTSADVTGQQ
ncbi:MAG: hypothetical protein ACPGTS_00755 [Minisyncoccia bacterium]